MSILFIFLLFSWRSSSSTVENKFEWKEYLLEEHLISDSKRYFLLSEFFSRPYSSSSSSWDLIIDHVLSIDQLIIAQFSLFIIFTLDWTGGEAGRQAGYEEEVKWGWKVTKRRNSILWLSIASLIKMRMFPVVEAAAAAVPFSLSVPFLLYLCIPFHREIPVSSLNIYIDSLPPIYFTKDLSSW